MEDKVFGNLSFRVGWIKEEAITLWNKECILRIRISSKKDEAPTQLQQDAYLEFKKNVEKLCLITIPLIKQFVLSNKEKIVSEFGEDTLEDPFSLIRPKEVLFFQNGKYAIICNTVWSEAGMAVLCDSGTYYVNESYILEFEY